MAHFTINSPRYGRKTFYVRDTGGYVHLESDRHDRVGELAPRICKGGFHGPAISATPESLPDIARKWWRKHRAELVRDGF